MSKHETQLSNPLNQGLRVFSFTERKSIKFILCNENMLLESYL